jgi:magnesium transporter
MISDRFGLQNKTISIEGTVCEYSPIYFSNLLKRRVCADKINNKLGKLSDLVITSSEVYPEVVGLFLYHGWGSPTEFIPWERVKKIEDDAIFVLPPNNAESYPPFPEDTDDYMLLGEHLMGCTILDIDGRTTEVVNDVILVQCMGKLYVAHVDTSMNGFIRRIGLMNTTLFQDRFIPWKYVQPLSVKESPKTDQVALKITRHQLLDLPPEDLANVLETLNRKEQSALFSVMKPEKAADALSKVDPRTKRHIMSWIKHEKAKTVFSEMTAPQIADLFSVLPVSQVSELILTLEPTVYERVSTILLEDTAIAKSLMTPKFFAMTLDTLVGEALSKLKMSGKNSKDIYYLYVVDQDHETLLGVIGLKDLVFAEDSKPLSEVMILSMVSADENDTKETLEDLFIRYHHKTIPVVTPDNKMVGMVRYNDVVKDSVDKKSRRI